MIWWQYLLLVNLYLVLFYGFYTLLLRSETFFQLNRIYLVTSSLLSFLIPVIHSDWIKNLFITQKVQSSLSVYSSPIMVYKFQPVGDHPVTIGQLILYIYAAGAIVLTMKFIWQLISLKKIIDQPGTSGAFSFFKNIRLGANTGSQDVIAAHEQVHAREWHSADILLIEAVAIINWFNPVVYFYRFGIKHIHEFIADRQAIKNGTSKAEYALLLLSQTLETPAHQLVNPFFNHSLLKQRIIMLQKNHSQRTALLKYGLSAPLFILMLILSSATISKSTTVKLLNHKAEQVFLIPASTSGSKIIEAPAVGSVELKEIKGEKQTVQLTDPKTVSLDTVPVSDKVFSAVEKEPEFKGGMEAFYQFLQQNIHYPAEMRKNKVEGKVFITFIVEEDGSLSNIKVVRGIGYGSDEESERVLKLSPKWNPGLQNGRTVRVQYTMPISFTLGPVKVGEVESKKDIPEYGKNNLLSDTNKKILVTSFNNYSPKPLFVVDGREVPNIDNMNPNSIQSINVLKPKHDDDSLVELYGTKALNGVIVVTTKKAAKSN